VILSHFFVTIFFPHLPSAGIQYVILFLTASRFMPRTEDKRAWKKIVEQVKTHPGL
jgi:hypothetical protein